MPGAGLRAVSFAALRGWQQADLAAAWQVFCEGAAAMACGTLPLRPAIPSGTAFSRLLRAVASQPSVLSSSEARSAFEHWFEPAEIEEPGFLTGYYEPVVEGSPVRTAEFTAPVLPRPEDLVTLSAGEIVPGVPAGYAAARRDPDGRLTVYPDRAALEALALDAETSAVAWLRDWTEVFLIQVQGSARVRFPDGQQHRLVYAGRNGHPYTSIGRLLVEAGEISPEAMSLDALEGWLRRNGQEPGQAGRSLMHRNCSYVYFRLAAATDDQGPIGGAGVPLVPRRSIAVDRTIWSYGLPFWIESDKPLPGFGPEPLRDLFLAQDTGSAIVGAARADLFMGTGEAAGHQAGSIRHGARFVALLPRER